MGTGRIASALTLCVALAGCGATVINTETTVTVPTTTVVPRGDAAALIDNIVAAAAAIGELVADGDGDAARRLQQAALDNWAELEPLVVESGVDIKEQIETVIALIDTAVTRRRPADADKAYRFAVLVAETIDLRLN